MCRKRQQEEFFVCKPGIFIVYDFRCLTPLGNFFLETQRGTLQANYSSIKSNGICIALEKIKAPSVVTCLLACWWLIFNVAGLFIVPEAVFTCVGDILLSLGKVICQENKLLLCVNESIQKDVFVIRLFFDEIDIFNRKADVVWGWNVVTVSIVTKHLTDCAVKIKEKANNHNLL